MPPRPLKAEVATPARKSADPLLNYQEKLKRIHELQSTIEAMSYRIDRGEEIKDETIVISSATFIVSVAAGIWTLRSAGSHGETGCLRFLAGLGIISLGGTASVAGGIFFWTLHDEEVHKLLDELDLREQELRLHQQAADDYLREHPELSQALKLRSGQSIYDEEIAQTYELERAVDDLSLQIKHGEGISARAAVIGSLALFVSVIAGRWVWRMQSRGSLSFAGNVAAIGVGTLTFMGEGIYWCFNSSQMKSLRQSLQKRRQELELKKAAVEHYLKKDPVAAGAHH